MLNYDTNSCDVYIKPVAVQYLNKLVIQMWGHFMLHSKLFVLYQWYEHVVCMFVLRGLKKPARDLGCEPATDLLIYSNSPANFFQWFNVQCKLNMQEKRLPFVITSYECFIQGTGISIRVFKQYVHSIINTCFCQ